MPDVPKFNPAPEGGHLYEQVADHLAARITFGDIAAGIWLPSERELAADYAVSIDTISKAIRMLRQWHMVRTAPPRGTFVAQLHE